MRLNSTLDSSPLNSFKEWINTSDKDTISSTGFDFSICTNEILPDDNKTIELTETIINRMRNAFYPFSSNSVTTISENTGIPRWFFNNLNSKGFNNTISLNLILKYADVVGVSPAYLLDLTDEEDLYIVKKTNYQPIDKNENIVLTSTAKAKIREKFLNLTISEKNKILDNTKSLPKHIGKQQICNQKYNSLPMEFIVLLAEATNCTTDFLLCEDKSTQKLQHLISDNTQIGKACVNFKRHSNTVFNLYTFFCNEISCSQSFIQELCNSLFVLFVYFDSNTIFDILSNFNATIKTLANMTKSITSDNQV